jgi:alanine racemase
VPDEDIEAILHYRITACVAEEDFARRLSEYAVCRQQVVEAHVKVDTGMRRVGIEHEKAADAIQRISQLPRLGLTGIFSHFACSDAPDLSVCWEQLKRFHRVTGALAAAGFKLPMLHMANSAAVLRMPESYLDCVRPGLILYGLYPRGLMNCGLQLRPALSLHTRIFFCKKVKAGDKLGYGHTFTTWRDSVIATIPIGYHDGFVRQYSNLGQVLIRGRRAPVVGRVCMDQTLVDVTDIPGVSVGDEVVIYGEQGGRRISIEEMASLLDKVPYELTCSVGGRVRRQYLLDSVVVGETPMRSLVPPAVVSQICAAFPAHERAQEQAARRGAA